MFEIIEKNPDEGSDLGDMVYLGCGFIQKEVL